MKRTLIVTILLGSAVGVFSQGQIQFNNRQTTGTVGAPNEPIYQPIYGVDPANPTTVKKGASNAAGGTAGAGGNPIPALGTTDYSGRASLAGTGFTAQLWYGAAGTAEANLVLAGNATTTFRTSGTTVGAWTGTTAALDNPAAMIPGGANSINTATFQVRVWDNVGGTVTSWAAVMAAANNGVGRGSSDLFSPPFNLGGGTDAPPNMINFRSFALFTVPEPSMIALGALGLGALLLRRRKA